MNSNNAVSDAAIELSEEQAAKIISENCCECNHAELKAVCSDYIVITNSYLDDKGCSVFALHIYGTNENIILTVFQNGGASIETNNSTGKTRLV